MGKKHKHSKDKLYKTVSELTSNFSGSNRDHELSYLHRRIKFDTCCLSLDSISEKPMGLTDDTQFCYVFEAGLIIKFLEKYQLHPITGRKISAKDLFKLNFHKNEAGEYHCPVTYKLLNQHSKIVANKKTGHVYSYEACHQLNLKVNHLRDLLTDEPFQKSDIVTIQDPDKANEKWNVSNFYHVKNSLKIKDDDPKERIRGLENSTILKSCLDEYKKKATAMTEIHEKIFGPSKVSEDVKQDKFNSANHSDGRLSSSVTSTIMPATCSQAAATLTSEQVLYPKVKKKGYVQMVTNFGPINLELYCDRTPKACHNFLLLATRGYYDNTCFHRLIKNFILQGGDPSGTGKGGQSAWGEPFKDECFGDLKHEGRGVLAMANAGPNSNKSQFYITLKGIWDHLDGKHTVFGRVVGGDDTLSKIESVEVDKSDKPKREIKIIRITKYVDPFEEAELSLERDRQLEIANAKKRRSIEDSNDLRSKPLKKLRDSGVGVYLQPKTAKLDDPSSEDNEETSGREQTTKRLDDYDPKASERLKTSLTFKSKSQNSNKFGNFSSW